MPASVADIFKMMQAMDNSLNLNNGEPDEERGVTAVTMAQHYFETVAATYGRVLGSTITVSPTSNVESTTYPSSLLRLDSVWLIDSVTSLPIRRLRRIETSGGNAPSLPWPLQLVVQAGIGTPRGYFADMRNFYWLPLPDANYSLRVYGLLEQPEFESRLSAFNYPLRTKPAIASFACKVMKTSVDDDTADLDSLAAAMFGPLMKGLKQFDRSEPHGRAYGEIHDT